MTHRERILARLAGDGESEPLWLPNLGLWHRHHSKRGSLPVEVAGASLVGACRALSAPAFVAVPPFRVELDGAEVRTEEAEGERVVTSETSDGTLTARWMLMPDGEWWQTEYPVKSPGDLRAARALVAARRYVLDPAEWVRTEAEVGPDGVVALELPRRPFSEVLHTLLGWSDGLFLMLGEGRSEVREILDLLEERVQTIIAEIARLPGRLAYSPDNLDGNFVSPAAFAENLAASYHLSAEVLRGGGKSLVVHVGGPARRLLAPLASAGVAGVEGVAGPPQGDSSLGEARRLAGSRLALWGGIPQDYLLAEGAPDELDRSIREAVELSRQDRRVVVGVADQVPTGATFEAIRHVGELVERYA